MPMVKDARGILQYTNDRRYFTQEQRDAAKARALKERDAHRRFKEEHGYYYRDRNRHPASVNKQPLK